MSALSEVGGYLLAGGKSSRMGKDKALLTLGGERLVSRGLRKLGGVCTEVAIAGGSTDLARFGRVVPDRSLGCGPLGGIVAALEDSSFDWNLFLPVDVPFVPLSALNQLLAVAGGFDGVCVMSRTQGLMQPLCAMYSRRALEVLQQELAAERWKVTKAIEAAGSIRFVNFEDASRFANLNTPEEFAEAEKHLDALDT